MPRRVLAILNPISGRRGTAAAVREVGRRLEQAGVELAVRETTGPGHATELARAAAGKVDAILVAGGDGTVSEVVNGLLRQPCPVVVLGSGTENLIAKEFQMPRTASEAVRALLHGKQVQCDVGVVNERHFLALVGVGFDADVVDRLVRKREGHIGYLSYFWPIWHTFWTHQFPPLRVEVDGECIFEGKGMAILGVIGRYATGLRILARARCDDGLLDVCVLPCRGRAEFALQAWRVWRGKHTESESVVYRQGKNVTITSRDPVHYEVDGDTGGHLPVRCSVLPRAVTFLKP